MYLQNAPWTFAVIDSQQRAIRSHGNAGWASADVSVADDKARHEIFVLATRMAGSGVTVRESTHNLREPIDSRTRARRPGRTPDSQFPSENIWRHLLVK